MAAFAIAILVFAFAVWNFRRRRIPKSSVRFSGTIVEVLERKSTGNRNATLYGPKVSYQHPKTGETNELPPNRYTPTRHSIGHPVELAYDQSADRVMRPPDRPWIELGFPFVIGVCLVVIGVLS